MDKKTVFVKTRKGEDEMHSRTMHLPGDIKRALLMVDGISTCGEISKRAAPSLRDGLDAMLQELEKDGYIEDKDKDKDKAGNLPRKQFSPRMSVPLKMATPHKPKPANDDAGDLDFLSGFGASSSKASVAEPDEAMADAGKLKAEAEAIARQEIEVARAKAHQEAESILHQAEQEAARIREEAQAVKARLDAEARPLRQAEAERIKAEQIAAITREAARARAEAEKQNSHEAAAKITQVPQAAKPATFAFDSFHIDEPQHLDRQQKIDLPAQKANPTGMGPTGIGPAGKPGTFSFDSFHVDIPQPSVLPPKKQDVSPAQQPASAAHTVQPVETRQPVQQEAPVFVAGIPDGGAPGKDEIQQAIQERIAVEKRLKEEALAAKKQAEAKAKARAEAERRAAEAAREEIEQAARKVGYSVDVPAAAPVAMPAPVARVRRKPFSWGRLVGTMFKLGVFLLVLLVGALFAAPHVLPMRDYMPRVEKILSERLQQPVHIGRLSGRILPTPRLELGEIYIGKAKQFQADQALINFAISGLFIEAKPIDSIELQGVKVSGAGLQSVSAWMQHLAADNQYPVARMTISQGMLDADAVQFTGVEGTLNFNPYGEFTKASLRSNAGKYTLDISAGLGNKLQVAITMRESALPLLPNWPFDELTAKGELSNSDLSISEFNGRILDGVLQGNASLNWRSGWRAQGTLTAKTIAMQRLNSLLEGNVDGSARFRMASADMAGLVDSAELDGSFIAKNGVISGMDIVATARTRSREHLPGGRTHFDELSGMVVYADNALHFKQTKITTNVLDAVATLDIDKQVLSGNVVARLSMQEAMKPANLQIGGVADNPTLFLKP